MTDPNCNDQRIYIGRLGYEVELECVEAWDISGDTARIKGALVSTSVEEALVLRQQLNGYIGNLDEDVIPIVWNAHPAMNGFYRVRGGDVNFAGSSLRSGIFDFSLEVERVASSAGPLFESVLTGAVRVNSHGLTGVHGWVGLPHASRGTNFSPFTSAAPLSLRSSESGEVDAGDPTSFVDVYVDRALSSSVSFWLPPENWLDGACAISMGGGVSAGSAATGGGCIARRSDTVLLDAYRTVVGSQVPNHPRQWLLSNGLVRIYIEADPLSPAAATFWFEWWCGNCAVWRGNKGFIFTSGVSDFGGSLLPWNNLTILRNSPEECAIRLTAAREAAAASGFRSYVLDIKLRRGGLGAEVFLSQPDPTNTTTWAVRRDVAEAATAVTGGIHATATDSNSMKYVLSTPGTKTNDLVNGKITTPTGGAVAANASFLVANAVTVAEDTCDPPALPTLYATPADIIDQYMAAQSERVVVTGR